MSKFTNTDEWDSFKSDSRTVGRWSVRWTVAIVIFCLLLVSGIWGLTVLLAPIRGEGDKQIIKYDAANMIAAQERFEDLYQDILQTDHKIQVIKESIETDIDKTKLQGLQTYCFEIVGEYNAAARKFTQEDFKAIDLPDEIDNSSKETDCK